MKNGPPAVFAGGRPPFWRLCGPWAALFAVFCAVYLATAQRGVGWSDNGFFQWRILTGDCAGSMGLAQAHPACVALGWMAWGIPIGNPWWRISAFGAPAMAVAVANVALLVRFASGRWSAACAAALLLGTAHLPWFDATSAKTVHAFSAAFLSTELLLLLGLVLRPDWRWLAALGFAAGLHWSFHNFALLATPVYVVVTLRLLVQRRLPVWAPAPALALFAVGAAPILWLTASAAAASGSWMAAVRDLLFGHFEGAVLGRTGHAAWFRLNLAIFALNFWNPFWLGALPGMWAFWRAPQRLLARSVLAVLLIHALFVARYTVIDQATFALPTLTVLAVMSGTGVACLMCRSAAWRRALMAWALLLACLAPVAYLALNGAAHQLGFFPARSRTLPFRDEARTWIVPWKQDDHSADAFAAAALAQIEPDAVILADWSAGYPLLLTQRVCGAKPRAIILTRETCASNDAVFAAAETRPRYVVSPVAGYVPPAMLDGTWAFTPTGVLYRVTRSVRGSPAPVRPEAATPPGAGAAPPVPPAP